MDKTISKNVSGFTNNSEVPDQPAFVSNRWQPDWPDYTITIAWPQTPPDLLSIPANQLKQLMLQARAYDPRAIEIFTTLAMPIAKHYSSLPNVVSVLGKDEAYGIANHTMMDFLMHERLRNDKQDIPTMLKRAIRCDLMNQIDRIKNRRHFETYTKPGNSSQSEDDDDNTDFIANLPADTRLEPERQALLAEQKHRVRECLQYLSPKEKQVIIGFFYRQLSVAEMAAELQCTTNAISLAKRSALYKLRRIFAEQQIV